MRIPFFLACVILFVGCQSLRDKESLQQLNEALAPYYDDAEKPFYHGVASGDPLADRVIIWTRVTPEDSVSSIEVRWEMAENARFDPVLQQETVKTSPDKDYTVKVDVTGLEPNRYYYYRFKALDGTSPVGRTKTLPHGPVDSLKFAVVSCSNWQNGYFNAYDRIAEREVDVVLHLGDYIYESGASKKGVRTHVPEHEIVTLEDYRTRYSQYHLDEGLQKLGQKHPIIAIWDDHELANNTYAEGAGNHQPEKEGDFATRKAAARKAYYEWIPIREGGNHYRTFSFGGLAELIMLDERQEGRTEPAEGLSDPEYASDERSMLGGQQLNWFESQLKNSSATWKIIGNQVIFSDLDRSVQAPNSPRNMDSWDGYPAEKMKIAEVIKENDLNNIIFLTGDTHSSWAFEVVADPLKQTMQKNYDPIAVEFGTTSVSSGNSNEARPDSVVIQMEEGYLKTNPHLKFVNRRDHGYLLLTVYAKGAKADWYYVDTLLRPSDKETLAQTLRVDLNSNRLQ